MKKTLYFSLVATFIIGCGGATTDQTESDTTNTAGQEVAEVPKEDGEKIYKTYCVTCHGLYGNMGGSGAFDLTKSELSLDERIQVITKGRNVMIAFESLMSEEKIKAVAAYTLTLKEK
ncbi:MAG: c-type cytochrome [Saprospiraceae bacterium]|jgi:mono/diheme cytochrome c family protein